MPNPLYKKNSLKKIRLKYSPTIHKTRKSTKTYKNETNDKNKLTKIIKYIPDLYKKLVMTLKTSRKGEYGIKIGDAIVSRLNGVIAFSFLIPNEEYKHNIHLPLLMTLGEEHLFKSNTEELKRKCTNCNAYECINLETQDFYELLTNVYKNSPFAIDVYGEDWLYGADPDRSMFDLYSGYLTHYHERIKNLNSSKIRAQFTDVRRSITPDFLIDSLFPNLLEILLPDGTINYRLIVDRYFDREINMIETEFSPIGRQLFKQDSNMLSIDGRQMNDITLWKDVFELCIRHKCHKRNQYDITKKGLNNSNDVKKIIHINVYLFLANTVIMDIYFLMRMMKNLCVQRDQPCEIRYAELALYLCGSSHADTVINILTNPFSPIAFYKIHTFLNTENFPENNYCFDFNQFKHNIDLNNELDTWRQNHTMPKQELLHGGILIPNHPSNMLDYDNFLHTSENIFNFGKSKKSKKSVRKSKKSVRKSKKSVRKSKKSKKSTRK